MKKIFEFFYSKTLSWNFPQTSLTRVMYWRTTYLDVTGTQLYNKRLKLTWQCKTNVDIWRFGNILFINAVVPLASDGTLCTLKADCMVHYVYGVVFVERGPLIVRRLMDTKRTLVKHPLIQQTSGKLLCNWCRKKCKYDNINKTGFIYFNSNYPLIGHWALFNIICLSTVIIQSG